MGAPEKINVMNLEPGTRLGKYEIVRRIAIGGMAELYLARTTAIGGFEKLVVLKRILPQHADDPAFIEMFLDEARLAATLHHHNIAQVHDIGVDEGAYFFAMEYVHGADIKSISTFAAESRVEVPLECIITIVVGATNGLHYAHEKVNQSGELLGLVHRDVSPQNILVSYDGSVKLVDFGIAKAKSSTKRTGTGSLKGKISYMSPEQCMTSVPLDRRSDIFSVGTLLWELSTNRRLVDDESEYAALRQIVEEDAPRPTTICPGYPPALEAIVMKALQRDRDKRYATAALLQDDLEDFAHEQRLRISTKTLANFMERLFGKKLDEWNAARSKGAFFVEEHVVKTLAGQQEALAQVAFEEETTDVAEIPLPPAADTQVTAMALMPEPMPLMQMPVQQMPVQEVPAQFTTVPSWSDAAEPAVSLTPAPRRTTWLWVTLVLALAGGIAAVVISKQDSSPASSPGQAEPARQVEPASAGDGIDEPTEEPIEERDDEPIDEPDPVADEAAAEVVAEPAARADDPASESDDPEPEADRAEPTGRDRKRSRKRRAKTRTAKKTSGKPKSDSKPDATRQAAKKSKSWNSKSMFLPDK